MTGVDRQTAVFAAQLGSLADLIGHLRAPMALSDAGCKEIAEKIVDAANMILDLNEENRTLRARVVFLRDALTASTADIRKTLGA